MENESSRGLGPRSSDLFSRSVWSGIKEKIRASDEFLQSITTLPNVNHKSESRLFVPLGFDFHLFEGQNPFLTLRALKTKIALVMKILSGIFYGRKVQLMLLEEAGDSKDVPPDSCRGIFSLSMFFENRVANLKQFGLNQCVLPSLISASDFQEVPV